MLHFVIYDIFSPRREREVREAFNDFRAKTKQTMGHVVREMYYIRSILVSCIFQPFFSWSYLPLSEVPY